MREIRPDRLDGSNWHKILSHFHPSTPTAAGSCGVRGRSVAVAGMTNARERRALIAVPSITDVVGAGGVAPRWRGYARELEASGWVVDLWTVDAADASQRIPRCVHPFFPKTLTDVRSSRVVSRARAAPSRPSRFKRVRPT